MLSATVKASEQERESERERERERERESRKTCVLTNTEGHIEKQVRG